MAKLCDFATKIEIYEAQKSDITRVFELLSRTNQMNITLKILA